MPREILTQYETDQESFLLNRLIAQALPAGVYAGYDATLGNTMELVFQHASTGKKSVNIDNSETVRRGLIFTKHGCAIFEPDAFSLNISPTGATARRDAIYLEHNFVEEEGGSDAQYGVIEGFISEEAPFEEAIGTNRVLIATLFLPANTTALNASGVVYTPYRKNDLAKMQILIDTLFANKYDKEQNDMYVLQEADYGEGWFYDTDNNPKRPTVTRTQDDILSLTGEVVLIDSGVGNEVVFVLPTGYRPTRVVNIPILIVRSGAFLQQVLTVFVNGEARITGFYVPYTKQTDDIILLENIQFKVFAI